MLEDGERWRVVLGDCMATMAALPAESVDAVVTDPPYGLSEHNPTEVLACLSAWCRGEEYQPTGRGFMGKSWDAWVPGPAYWREALDWKVLAAATGGFWPAVPRRTVRSSGVPRSVPTPGWKAKRPSLAPVPFSPSGSW